MSHIAEQLAQQRIDHALHQRSELADFAERKPELRHLTVAQIIAAADESDRANLLARQHGKRARRFAAEPESITGFDQL